MALFVRGRAGEGPNRTSEGTHCRRNETKPRDGRGSEEASVNEALVALSTAEATLRESALPYKQELSWADPPTLEVTLAFIRASRMHRLATGRMMDQLEVDVSMTG